MTWRPAPREDRSSNAAKTYAPPVEGQDSWQGENLQPDLGRLYALFLFGVAPSRRGPGMGMGSKLRSDALAERGEHGAPDHGVRPKSLARHELLVQLGQPIEGDARVPVMLEVIADIARQDEDRLEPS